MSSSVFSLDSGHSNITARPSRRMGGEQGDSVQVHSVESQSSTTDGYVHYSSPRELQSTYSQTDYGVSDDQDKPWPRSPRPWIMEENHFHRKLKYFFMNPFEKVQANCRCPWKLSIQGVKLIFVTLQLIIFGNARSLHIDFVDKTNLAFMHLYLKDWSVSYETMPYPPSMGQFAVYTIADFYSSVDYVLNRYNQTEEIAIGNFLFTNADNSMVPVMMCNTFYKEGKMWAFNESVNHFKNSVHNFFILWRINISINQAGFLYCFQIYPVNITNSTTSFYSIEKYLAQINKNITFDSLINVNLYFALKTVHLKSLSKSDTPDCYQFNIQISYDNSGHNGQMGIVLKSDQVDLECHGKILYSSSDQWYMGFISTFDGMVLLVCLMSAVLCVRSIIRAMAVLKDTIQFFKDHYPDRKLTCSDRADFIDFWYIMIICGDVLTIIGCIFKILIETKWSSNYEICGILLGTANLCVWFSILRYLGALKMFNVLILTLKTAAPSLLKFLVCAFTIFFGFSISGWIVLGPYHIKFRKLTTSLECLYSLINGDDIYTTFATMTQVNWAMWLFSRIYLYAFMSLFIYVILSVFIAVIMDTYDNIKHPHGQENLKSRLRLYADECEDDLIDLVMDSTIRGCRWIEIQNGCLCICPFGCCRGNSEPQNVLVNEEKADRNDETTPLLSPDRPVIV